MRLDPLRGKGAFRCGCGAHIAVTIPQGRLPVHCAWRDCRLVPVRDYDVPLCADHAKRAREQLNVGPEVEYKADLMRRARRGEELNEQERTDLAEAEREFEYRARFQSDLDRVRREDASQVYFMRHDRIIKIGYSVDPPRRAVSLAGAVILATEPGGRREEEATHARFAHLRVHGEWFSPGPDLIEYINKLRKQVNAEPIIAESELTVPSVSRSLKVRRAA